MRIASKSDSGNLNDRTLFQDDQTQQDHPLRVLMVEDDQYYFRFAKRLLSQNSASEFEVLHADNLGSALEQLAEDTPDAIIIDLCLPDSAGLDTLSKVLSVSCGAPLVVLTGSDDEQVGLKAVSMGAQDFLVKHQVSNDSLVRSIRYAIERCRAEEATLRMAAIQDFTSTLAHDLQVPLTAGNTVLEGLLAGEFGELPTQMPRILADLQENNNHQLQCVKKLLDVYRYETRQHLQFQALEAKSLVVDSCQQVSARFDSKKSVKLSISEDLPKLLGDQEALSTLFTNLIENAVKFSDRESTVEVSAELLKDRVTVKVHNFGQPIPEQGQKQLFQKFWQGIPGQWYTAHTGIGLYLCNRIVLLHRGRITCRSTAEEGTLITVKLPAAEH